MGPGQYHICTDARRSANPKAKDSGWAGILLGSALVNFPKSIGNPILGTVGEPFSHQPPHLLSQMEYVKISFYILHR
jgi:hypothetical protein